MQQSAPVFGAEATDRPGLAAALGLREEDLVADRPARVVSTGAAHLLVPIRDRAAVDRAGPDAARLIAALRTVAGEGCYLYTLDPAGRAYTRFFNPAMGIPEDPATGTAAGPLAALLLDGAGDGTVLIEQGHSMGRPSTITVTVTGPQVRISGSGLVVGRGTLLVTAS
jgi:PhzF family phenazine biosynthesis protein